METKKWKYKFLLITGNVTDIVKQLTERGSYFFFNSVRSKASICYDYWKFVCHIPDFSSDTRSLKVNFFRFLNNRLVSRVSFSLHRLLEESCIQVKSKQPSILKLDEPTWIKLFCQIFWQKFCIFLDRVISSWQPLSLTRHTSQRR